MDRASLRAGALAVKHYAWYQVLHWRGGTNADGQCFDLRDDTVDQVYDPSKPTWTTAAAAVDATWSMRVLKDGKIFPTYYNAGSSGEACGANANGWRMYQWGTQACGLAGKTASQIVLIYYYPGVTVSGGTDPAPSPTPSPTPQPTPRRRRGRPPTHARSDRRPILDLRREPVRHRPRPDPNRATRRRPRRHATPWLPRRDSRPDTGHPTTPQQLPGGGQSGIVHAATPPPPPPDDPVPVVTHPCARITSERQRRVVRGPISLPRLLVWADRGEAPVESLWPAYRLVDMHAPGRLQSPIRGWRPLVRCGARPSTTWWSGSCANSPGSGPASLA